MQHPFDALAPEYAYLWFHAHTSPARVAEVDRVAQELLDHAHLLAFESVFAATKVPVLWHAPVLFRESDGDLKTYLGNGDPLDKPTTDVPRGRGPFASYDRGAYDALTYDHVTEVTAWSIERMLYEHELWNGFGYRNKSVNSPYLVGGTSAQMRGKYIADGRWDPNAMDTQLGTLPIARRMVELRPELMLPITHSEDTEAWLSVPPDGLGGEHDTAWIQAALNHLGASPPLVVDGSYGRRTRNAVMDFQSFHGLTVDGLVGPSTLDALAEAMGVL